VCLALCLDKSLFTRICTHQRKLSNRRGENRTGISATKGVGSKFTRRINRKCFVYFFPYCLRTHHQTSWRQNSFSGVLVCAVRSLLFFCLFIAFFLALPYYYNTVLQQRRSPTIPTHRPFGLFLLLRFSPRGLPPLRTESYPFYYTPTLPSPTNQNRLSLIIIERSLVPLVLDYIGSLKKIYIICTVLKKHLSIRSNCCYSKSRSTFRIAVFY
jgi:hypothetical protein